MMNKMKNPKNNLKNLVYCRAVGTTLPIVALALFICASASGVGLRDPNQDPEGIARGNAFAATADNPSAIYYNPAGITQLEGNNARVGLYFISADTTYTSPTGVKVSSFQRFITSGSRRISAKARDSFCAISGGVFGGATTANQLVATTPG